MDLITHILAALGVVAIPSFIAIILYYTNRIKTVSLNISNNDLKEIMQQNLEYEKEQNNSLRKEILSIRETNYNLVELLSSNANETISHYKDRNDTLQEDLMEVVKVILGSRDK